MLVQIAEMGFVNKINVIALFHSQENNVIMLSNINME